MWRERNISQHIPSIGWVMESQEYNHNILHNIQRDLGAQSVKVLVFPSPTGYMFVTIQFFRY